MGDQIFHKIELSPIGRLLTNPDRGFFLWQYTPEVGQRLESLFYMNNFEKLTELIKIFYLLSQSREVEMLNAAGVVLETTAQRVTQLDEVFHTLEKNFTTKSGSKRWHH